MKKYITYLLIFIPWLLGGLLFSSNPSFYASLNKPFFAPPSWIFMIVWTLLYIMITISIYPIITENKWKDIKEYLYTLFINYLSNQLFTFFFFQLQSPFLGFLDCMIVLMSSLFLYHETKSLNDISAKWLKPYLFWNIFATILSLSIYFMNL